MLEFAEAGSGELAAPGCKVMEGGIASILPAFLIVAVWVRAEQYAPRLESGVQLSQNARQFPGWYMKQRGVGEYSIKIPCREIELQEILLPDHAAAVGACHFDETRGTIQTDDHMTEAGEGLQIAAWAAAEVEDGERDLASEVAQQRGDVLSYVVVARSLTKFLGALVVMSQRSARDLFKIVGVWWHEQWWGAERVWAGSPSGDGKPLFARDGDAIPAGIEIFLC